MKLAILGISIGLALGSLSSYAQTRCSKDSSGNLTCRDTGAASPADLESIYGPGNPEAYIQGRKQIEQSNLQQEEMLRQKSLENQRAALANQYEAQNNALRLENQRLKNEVLANKNAEARLRYGSEGVSLSAAQYERLQRITDDELTEMIAQGKKFSAAADPAIQNRGQRLLQISRLAVEIRQKK